MGLFTKMDGKPGMAEQWEMAEYADPNVFRTGVISFRTENDHLRFDGTNIRDRNGIVAESTFNSLTVAGIIERLPADSLIRFWHELYRICACAAQVTIGGSYYSSVNTLADLTRLRGLSEEMFVYLSAPSRVWMAEEPGEDGTYLKLLEGIDFEPGKFVRVTRPEWEARPEDAKNWALTHSLNICKWLEVGLIVYKPARSEAVSVKR